MASIENRNEKYYIVFSKRIGGKVNKRRFLLKVNSRREAEKLKYELEDKVEEFNIDPFSDNFNLSFLEDAIVNKKRTQFLTVKEATELFLTQRNQANETTKKGYQRHFNMMFDLIGQTLPVAMITENDVRNLCFKEGIKINTQRSYLRHYKVFFNWAYEQGFIKENLTKNIKPPKEEDTLANKIITYDQLQLIFQSFDNHVIETNKKYSYLNMDDKMIWFKPILNTAFFGGLRISEVVNLKWKDVELEKFTLLVRNSETKTTKSGKNRVIPIVDELHAELIKWKEKTFVDVNHYVFKSPRSTDSTNIKADAGNISKKFKKFVRIVGLDEGIVFHGLRHTFATNAFKNSIPLPMVTKVLGHKDYKTTKKYEHLVDEDIKNAFRSI